MYQNKAQIQEKNSESQLHTEENINLTFRFLFEAIAVR